MTDKIWLEKEDGIVVYVLMETDGHGNYSVCGVASSQDKADTWKGKNKCRWVEEWMVDKGF